jgi:hypothetical protein
MIRLKLDRDWKRLLKRAWTVRISAATVLIGGVTAGLSMAQPYLGFDPIKLSAIVGALTVLSGGLTIYARIVQQQGID